MVSDLWRRGCLLVHLICLRCSRANPADAKFCGQCGAGLLRRFCADCHAVNDAESHFCQACGVALPASTLGAPSTMPPPDTELPSLTDVAYLEPDPVVLDPAAAPPAMHLVELPKSPVVATQSFAHPPAISSTLRFFRLPILLGAGSVGAAVLAALLWPAKPARVEKAADSSLAVATGGALAAAPAALSASAAAEVPPAVAEPAAATPPAAVLAAQPGPLATPREAAARVPPARPRPALPKTPAAATRAEPAAHECTPQVDALGLCAPNAKVAGR